jgi:hypothetical protein
MSPLLVAIVFLTALVTGPILRLTVRPQPSPPLQETLP